VVALPLVVDPAPPDPPAPVAVVGAPPAPPEPVAVVEAPPDPPDPPTPEVAPTLFVPLPVVAPLEPHALTRSAARAPGTRGFRSDFILAR
jgi:hypothetical protein